MTRTKTELLAGLRGTRCIADNKNGGKCKRWAIKGGSVCFAHGGAAPQVREAATRRLEGSIDRLLTWLLEIAEDEAQPAAARVAAIRDALDRVGFGSRGATVSIEVKPAFRDLHEIYVDRDELASLRNPAEVEVVEGELVDEPPERG